MIGCQIRLRVLRIQRKRDRLGSQVEDARKRLRVLEEKYALACAQLDERLAHSQAKCPHKYVVDGVCRDCGTSEK